jgi:hypothetical protein
MSHLDSNPYSERGAVSSDELELIAIRINQSHVTNILYLKTALAAFLRVRKKEISFV